MGKAVAKEARGSIPSRTNRDCSSPPGTAPRSASALPSAQTATHARHRAHKDVRMCVRDACSLTETTQRHARGGEQIDYVPRPHRHRLQVRQTVCLRLRALWKWSWFTQAVADITGRKLFNHLADDVADATFSKLVEIVRQERVLWVHAAPPHKTFSAERPPRGCRCGWFPCVCSFSFSVERFGHQECACVVVCLLMCFCCVTVGRPATKRVSQDGSMSGVRHRSCPRCLAPPRGSAASLQGKSLLQPRALGLSGPKRLCASTAVRSRVMGMVLTGARVALGTVISPHYWVPVGFLKLGVSKMGCSLASRWGCSRTRSPGMCRFFEVWRLQKGELPRFSERDHFGVQAHQTHAVHGPSSLAPPRGSAASLQDKSFFPSGLSYVLACSGLLRFGGDGTSTSSTLPRGRQCWPSWRG